MDLEAHYSSLHEESIEYLKTSTPKLDPNLDNPNDDRMGISLIIRPPYPIIEAIQSFFAPFKALEPNQYYYPASDIHLTVLSIISCFPGFKITQINTQHYHELILKALKELPPFELELRGLCLSKSGVLIQGFYQEGSLDLLRDRIRSQIKKSGLLQSIDSRYRIITAHSTVIRFRAPFQDQAAFLGLVEQNKNLFLGKFKVESLEFVLNDWYHKQRFRRLLYKYKL